MKTFKQFFAEYKRDEAVTKLSVLFEHEIYKRIPGTTTSYRQDSANMNTQTQRHSHVYAKLKGGGKELYSVNLDGSGHDGSTGIQIPTSHGDFFRSNEYSINHNNILEWLDLEQLQEDKYILMLFEDF